MLNIEKQKYPYSIDLSQFDNINDGDVLSLTYALETAGVKADCENLVLYPAKDPSRKTQQLIVFYLMGCLGSTIQDYDVFKSFFTPLTRQKRTRLDTPVESLETPEVEEAVQEAVEGEEEESSKKSKKK